MGEIKSVIGTVLIKSGTYGDTIEAFSGCGLCKGDTLQTIEDSKALVEWNDGSQLYINKETELDFHISSYPLTLRIGEIFSMMNLQKAVFKIKTPSVVLSVIGTDFDTEVNKDEQTTLRVLKGKVALKNKVGEVMVKKNQQVNTMEHTQPVVTPIQQKQNVGSWINPIKPLQNKTGAIMKKLVIGILVIVIGITGYWGYQTFFTSETKPSLPAPATSLGTDDAYTHYEKLSLMFPCYKVTEENARLHLPKDPNILELLNKKRQPTHNDISLLHSLMDYYKPALEEFEQGTNMTLCTLPGIHSLKGP